VRRLAFSLLLCPAIILFIAVLSAQAANPPELKGAFRQPQKNGWTYVHLEGSPREVGFQNGYLLAPEIQDFLKVVMLESQHDYKKDWSFFREAAEKMMWPHIEQEYREELQGIADGATAHGVKIDVWDVVGINAETEWGYYNKEYDKQHGIKSASIRARALQRLRRDRKLHERRQGRDRAQQLVDLYGRRALTITFDIAPARLSHADGWLAGRHSQRRRFRHHHENGDHRNDDQPLTGFDTAGCRSLCAQGGAIFGVDRRLCPHHERRQQRWLREQLAAADSHTNEIGRLELGLKNVTLERTKDGYFVGSNFPISEKLIREETDFDPKDAGQSCLARHARWEQLMSENKGKIDVAAAQRFLADHYDTIEKKEDANERTLDGTSTPPRGSSGWWALMARQALSRTSR
jgi:hypothetical protein